MPSSLVTGVRLARTQTLGNGMWTPIWLALDALRRMQGDASKLSGSGRSNALTRFSLRTRAGAFASIRVAMLIRAFSLWRRQSNSHTSGISSPE